MLNFLTSKLEFPPVETASKEGLLAVGGDLSVARILLAYKSGIFPWYNEESMILWWSPDPRMVLFPHKLHVSKSMQQLLKKDEFTVTYNKAFKEVILNCAKIKREGQEDTWITNEMVQAYLKLHELKYATSVEVWQGGKLVGGLYGIDLGHVFCGESMFAKVSNASKIGFITLVNDLKEKNYKLIDCQVYTQHLSSLGAEEIPRSEFMKILKR
ncbi:leucyl/phenylalanyl-tRNA--protein transferase [Zhouia sp. PK063]|uniref:leucyl/phenylalanyl-tRNA--protein transferase n=1 Tax=Zhouia sp. PK063 TaxID=3373602 RepID=UPI0037929F10